MPLVPVLPRPKFVRLYADTPPVPEITAPNTKRIHPSLKIRRTEREPPHLVARHPRVRQPRTVVGYLGIVIVRGVRQHQIMDLDARANGKRRRSVVRSLGPPGFGRVRAVHGAIP